MERSKAGMKKISTEGLTIVRAYGPPGSLCSEAEPQTRTISTLEKIKLHSVWL